MTRKRRDIEWKLMFWLSCLAQNGNAVNQIAVVNIYHNISVFRSIFNSIWELFEKRDDAFLRFILSSVNAVYTFHCWTEFESESSSHKKSIAAYSFSFFGRSNLHIVNILFDLFGNEKGIQIKITRKRKRWRKKRAWRMCPLWRAQKKTKLKRKTRNGIQITCSIPTHFVKVFSEFNIWNESSTEMQT